MNFSRLFAGKRAYCTLSVMLLFQTGLVDAASKVSEPAFCNPAAFDEKEIQIKPKAEEQDPALFRAHGFRLGKVTLVGVGVGNSKAESLIELSNKYSATSGKSKRYCTWYLNRPRGEGDTNRIKATETFIQKDIPADPREVSAKEAESAFIKVLDPVFDRDAISFLSCAEEQKYLALGCNNMMHRGPTVFGMLLAFAGCKAEHALEITNQVWGLNGVPRKVRMAAIRKAYDLGNVRPATRKRLKDLFSTP